MKGTVPLLCALLLYADSVTADLLLSSKGKARVPVIQQSGASVAEQTAAKELQKHLNLVTGADFVLQTNTARIPRKAILIGRGSEIERLFPDIDFGKLGPEEVIIRTKGDRLLLSGGRPRGTIYAVHRFLQDQCGVRWWTPWATTIPTNATLKIPATDVRTKPVFEYRGAFWYPGFEPTWKVRNGCNNETWKIPAEWGGGINYARSFAHSFNFLVPPHQYFATHPEWFSLINGQRTTNHAQLCLTNPKLRDFVAERAKEWLRESPDAQIVTITQNDWNGWCECPDCKAIDDAEESHAGTMIAFANYIAEKIEPAFPHAAVDTFAYTYTRKPPKTVQPRPNVIVRLCSIECNFRDPLDHPSNTAFAEDIRKWSEICNRLYVWDYTTDFKNYVHPHPNWFTLGPNLRFFQKHGVKGVFEQGAYAGHGAEMAEMRAWVLAQLLWNPHQDDRALIRQFLNGYYGDEAGAAIYRYLELVHQSSEGLFLGCYLRKEPPVHLRYSVLNEAELLWQKAERAVQKDPEKLLRVRLAHLPVRYAFLRNWNWLRYDCWEQNQTWPLPESRKLVADEFRTVAAGVPGKDWTRVGVLNEPGLTIESFLAEYGHDPVKQIGPPPSPRLRNPQAPADLPIRQGCMDLQDNVASLARPGKWAQIRPDDRASDRRAVWMPGDHREWAFRIPGTSLPQQSFGRRWKIYAVVRIKKTGDEASDTPAFTAGVYDTERKDYPAALTAKLSETTADYRSYLLGNVELSATRDIYIAPGGSPSVKAIWIDRIYLVPDP